ncbi:MAG TPA: Zn-ribbon domain-containing OB-fold protein [Chloroflexota bacterium]|jgi:hypothetical protein
MAAPQEYKKPLPTPSAVSQPFWDATKEHRLTFQRCRLCGTRVFYPRDICPGPQCFGVGTLEWEESTGKGRVYSFTISYQPAHPAFADDVPYVIAIIDLDEGWRMVSNIVNIDPKEVQVGMKVEVVWDDVTPEFTLPKFQPRKA